MTQPTFSLRIISPDRTLFEGDVTSVTASNKKGPFDILPFHSHFVSIVNGVVKLNLVDGTTKDVMVDDGIVKVYENKVYIFVMNWDSIDTNVVGTPEA